jgi:hypothetical protein
MRSIGPALSTHTLGIAALARRGGLSGLLPVIADDLIPSANLTHTAHNYGSEISLAGRGRPIVGVNRPLTTDR